MIETIKEMFAIIMAIVISLGVSLLFIYLVARLIIIPILDRYL